MQFEATLSSDSSVETQAMLEAVRSKLAPSLLPHFRKFRDELIAEHAKDVGHEGDVPAANDSGVSTPVHGASADNGLRSEHKGSSVAAADDAAPQASAKPAPKLSTAKAEVVADLSIRRDDLWDLLTNPGRIPMWSRAPAQVGIRSAFMVAMLQHVF